MTPPAGRADGALCWIAGAAALPLSAALAGMTGRKPPETGGWAVAAVCLVAATTDLARRRIPNWITYPAAAWLLAAAIFPHGPLRWLGAPPLPSALAGFAVGFGFLLLVFLASGLGAGDVKLAGALGLALGFPNVLEMLLWSYAAACATGFALLVATVGARTTLRLGWEIVASPFRRAPPSAELAGLGRRTVPMAPFYALGTFATLLLDRGR